MNPRVLELIKNPKNIQSEDLGLLKEEIHAFPYIQNIRALHLYGVHLYEKENYQKELSVTAAYTTDKKILYQLINGKIRQENKQEPIVEAQPSKTVEKPAQFAYKSKAFPIKRDEDISSEEKAKDETAACILPISHDVKPVFVNGERNRILFEGEENFLDEENSETIDIESTLESGILVTQKAESEPEPVQQNETQQIQAEARENTGENFSPETVINEDEILSESETAKVEDEENVSFQEVEPILPEVDIEDNAEENIYTENSVNENEVSPESGEQKAENVTLHETESAMPEVNAEKNAGEDFTPEIVINEDEISPEPEKTKVEETENTSFQEVESILPEVKIEDNTDEALSDAELVIENKEISASETTLQAEESDAEISFHGTDTFLPDIKIQTSSDEISQSAEISQPVPGINRHEEEMRRLIEEVEKKMKETKSAPQKEEVTEETESAPDHEISFAETQSFHFWSNSEESPASEELKAEGAIQEEHSEVQGLKPEPVVAEEPKEEIIPEEIPETQTTTWKPMSVESNMPDSLISKTVENQSSVAEVPTQEVSVTDEKPVISTEAQESEISEEVSAEEIPDVEEVAETADKPQKTDDLTESEIPVKDEEVPVMNVSFFGTDISSLSVEEKQKENKKESAEEKSQAVTMKNSSQPSADSNVPGFINTWQSWLKIDRTEEIEKEKEVIKEKAIENFIENNPKISQLKEESTYVVKEKNDDISHLMTETLANLYFEQKLYSKAVKAFEILKKKYPEKADYFNAKIKDVNDSKSGK